AGRPIEVHALVAPELERYRPIKWQASPLPPNYSVNRTLTRYAGSRRLPQALGLTERVKGGVVTEVNNRSTFVNLVAGFSIAVSGSIVIVALLENVLLYTVLTDTDFNQVAQGPPSDGTPVIDAFIGNHFHLFSMVFLLIAVFALVSSIGLFRRKNWARWCFIAVLSFVICWLFSGLVLQLIGYATAMYHLGMAHIAVALSTQPSSVASDVLGVLFLLGICGVCGRIIKRLVAPTIAAEFCQ
ncbi:MAG: hypothetical protein ACU4EP_00010, partial [Candidatus Nitrosoglobus sp.]